MSVSMCANRCVYAFRDQKILSTLLELELQDIVSCLRYVWELKCPLKKEQVLLSDEPSLQSQKTRSLVRVSESIFNPLSA